MEGREEGCGLFCSPKLPHFRTVSTILTSIEVYFWRISTIVFLVFFQIDDMINELKFRDYVATGKYVTEIDLGQFIRRKYCTNN